MLGLACNEAPDNLALVSLWPVLQDKPPVPLSSSQAVTQSELQHLVPGTLSLGPKERF